MGETMTDGTAVPKPAPRLLAGPGLKLLAVGGLLLAMLIPHWMIEDVIADRERYSGEARAAVAGSWGPAQRVLGPVLIVPTRTPVQRAPGDVTTPPWQKGAVAVLPQRLRAEARLTPERRRRGLFETVVYGAEVALSGTLQVPPIGVEGGTELLWPEAYLLSGATDLRGTGDEVPLTLDGRRLTPTGDAGGTCREMELLRWDLGLTGPPPADRALPFTGSLSLRGTGSLHLLTAARRSEFEVAAPWPTPSFSGTGLPVRSEVREDGFSASWSEGGSSGVLRLSYDPCRDGTLTARSVGVELLEAVPTYRMVNRASKYAFMFLALAFLTYTLFEMIARVRIHVVQYGLLGCSVVLFPLLLLAFGEPLGFVVAYAISSAMVVAQASGYTLAVTRRTGLAGVFAAILAGLFGFLYVVLSLESYALLTGAVALFAALTLVMVVTRRVSWAG